MKDYLDYCERKVKEETCCVDGVTESSYFGTSPLPDCPVTAMAYVPFQTDTGMYNFDTALKNGTLYPNLNKPFLGGKCI